MQTIVLTTQKGGSGKSTLSISLALAAIRAGHNVRLIETDPQGTVSNWKRRRPYAAPIVEPIYAARELEQRLQSLAHTGVTVTIVDTAGGETAATNSAIRYSDLCLIRRGRASPTSRRPPRRSASSALGTSRSLTS
jgi:chromosome partitioning protein